MATTNIYKQVSYDESSNNFATNDLLDLTQQSLTQARSALEEVKALSDEVRKQNIEIDSQKASIQAWQAIVAAGFILAIVSLVGIIITDITFLQTSTKQIIDQTVLLKSIEDKVK